MNANLWTEQEDAYLRANAKLRTRAQIAEALGRTIKAVRGRAALLKIDMRKRPRTLAAEAAGVVKCYEEEGMSAVLERWPDGTREAVMRLVRAARVKREANLPPAQRWSSVWQYADSMKKGKAK